MDIIHGPEVARPFPACSELVIRQEVHLAKATLKRDQIRFVPLPVSQALPDRLQGDLRHGDANKVGDERRLGAIDLDQAEQKVDILQRSNPVACFQRGVGMEGQILAAALHSCQMRQQAAKSRFVVDPKPGMWAG